MSQILVTGGAGFIGSHIVDKLVVLGHTVTILDNLVSTKGELPDYINKNAVFINGDINDKELLDRIINNFDFIFHEAASVGIAQSNYEIRDFMHNNVTGTANLLQSIIDSKCKPKLILSASNTTYGEGIYNCNSCGDFHAEIRTNNDIMGHGLEITCPKCHKVCKPIPTPETTSLNCNSVYALSKKYQEELILFLGKLYNFPVVILKYFNAFGPRQSLSNPYTGVSAIFTSRIKNNNPIVIYEDGLQTRDFVYIDDIVQANILAMENNSANYETFNVGSGNPVTIRYIAEKIYELFGKDPNIELLQKYRNGDIRHCIADNSKIREKLGWAPRVSFDDGIKRLFEWSKDQESQDNFDKANSKLKEKGLI